ncbi:hypothetical protein GVX82_01720 [Patescibacteria group bacterium]|nr:hypothetical protein [Patescibacteria group bacterium]
MNSNEIKTLKRTLSLSKRQKEMLVGLVLGDGHLETSDNGRTYRLKVEHCMEQEEYVHWLHEEFREWVRGEPYIKVRTSGQRSIGFTTYAHGAFRFFAQQFYASGTKRMPDMLPKLLTPLGLALWYLDDGSRKSREHTTYVIHAVGYTKRELGCAQQALAALGVATSLHKQPKHTWRIYVLSRSAERFRSLIEPHVEHLATMSYKLDNTLPKE